MSAGAGHSTTSSNAGEGGGGNEAGAGNEPVTSSGGTGRGGGGNGESGAGGGSSAGGSGAGGNAGESGDGDGGGSVAGSAGSVAGSGQAGGRAGGGGTSGAVGQAGESGAAGDAGDGNCAGSGPVPISTFGLVYWFSADSGVTEADGGVSQWCDGSGNGAHATQRSVGPRPNLRTFPGTDRPAIFFDGVDEYLDLPPQAANFEGGLTFFCVARATYDSNNMAMLTLSNGEELNDVSFLRWNDAFTYEVADGFKWDGSWVVEEPRLVDVVHAANGTVSLFMNGVPPPNDSAFPTPFPIERSQNFIGRTLYRESTTWSGEIAEIVLYSRPLDAGDRQTIRSYLSKKWNCCNDSGPELTQRSNGWHQ